VRSAWVFALSVGTQASQVRDPLTVLIVTMHTGTESLTFRKPVFDSCRAAVQSTDASASSQQLQRSFIGRNKHTRWSRSYAAAACRTAYRGGIVCRAASTPPTKGKSISFTIPIDYSQVLLQLSCSAVITADCQSRQFLFRQRLTRLSSHQHVLLLIQLLGLKGRETYMEPQIAAAFEDLASTSVEEGYSSRVQDGKLRMLDQAAEHVSNMTGEANGDEVQVQWDDLPGALALLQEVCKLSVLTTHSGVDDVCLCI